MYNLLNARIIFSGFIYFSFYGNSFAAYEDRHAEGWHFYEELPVVVEDPKPKPQTPQPAPAPQKVRTKTPTEILTAFKAELTKRLHKAIVSPTPRNIQAYQEIQKVMLDRAELFGSRWMEVVFRNPHLDYGVRHPASQAGRHIYLDQQRAAVTRKIQALGQTHGLFFFFRGDCPYCHQFAPILKSFARKYDLKILAISLDGSKLADFPEAIRDNGAAERLNVTVYPTLLAVNPQSEEVVPLSYGFSTQDQMEERVRRLVKGQ